MLKVYFAGPDVFRSNPQEYFDKIAEKCVKHNIIPLFPMDADLFKSASIYSKNIKLLNDCHIVVANVEPFRGASMDVGTAFEIGYARALLKPIVAYTHSPMVTYKTRVTEDMVNISPDYPYVENFSMYENLMIVHSCDFIHDNIDKALYNVSTLYKWILD